MPKFNKVEALHYLEHYADVFDSPRNPRNPFATSVWLHHFVEDAVRSDWTLYFAETCGDGRSVMPLLIDPERPSRVRSLANFYTSLFSPLSSTAEDRPRALRAIVSSLAKERPRLSAATFAPLDAACPDVAALEDSLTGEGWFVRRYFCFGNWTLPVLGQSFEQYMARRDSRLRNTFERKAKKLLATGSIELVTRPDGVDQAMTAYESIYAKSWKRPEPYPTFARGWARRCAEQGWLRLGLAKVGDVPIAAQIWFVFDRRAFIYKLVYDDEFAKWSAGTVLTAHMMRHALDVDHVDEVDFLTGDDPYKSEWMTERRERIGIVACNLRSAEGLLLATKEFAGRATAPLRAKLRPAVVNV